jgi:hypothetical protein
MVVLSILLSCILQPITIKTFLTSIKSTTLVEYLWNQIFLLLIDAISTILPKE